MKFWKKILLAMTSILTTSLFPIIFLYCTNIGEVNFNEIVQPSLEFLFISSILFVAGLFIYKNVLKATFISVVFILLFVNYTSIETIVRKLNYNLRYWHIVSILLFLFAYLCYYVYKWNSEEIIKRVLQLVSIMFCSLIAVNGIMIAPDISSYFFQPQTQEEETTMVFENQNYPDVYYIVLDEYSQFDVMEKYYGYYPAEFREFLEKNDFIISDTSNNEDFWTHITNTNTLNLNYILNQDNASKAKNSFEYRKNPELFKVFSKYGYEINIASQSYPLIWKGIQYITDNPFGDSVKDNIFQKELNGGLKEFHSLIYKKTPLYVLNSKVASNSIDNFRHVTNSLFDFIEFHSNEAKAQPKFVYVHICSPHPPFVFDSKGNPVNNFQRENWKDKQYYLEQYQYVTNKIQGVLEQLLLNNPDSVIVLQSDHSARGGIGVNNILPEDIMPIDKKDRIKILNAVYYKGSDIDIEGQSGLNTWRIILNELFDLEYELLEVPEL